MEYRKILGYPGYVMDSDGNVWNFNIETSQPVRKIEANDDEIILMAGKNTHYGSLRVGSVVVEDIDKPAAEDAKATKEEGEYSLKDALEKVRTKAAFEEICEANGIEIPDLKTLKAQKNAVLAEIG